MYILVVVLSIGVGDYKEFSVNLYSVYRKIFWFTHSLSYDVIKRKSLIGGLLSPTHLGLEVRVYVVQNRKLC